MARAILLALCLQTAAAGSVFFAKLLPLESHGPMGWVAVAVTRKGLLGAGVAKGLEPKLLASPLGVNCTAANGCGAHVHSGTACANVSTQGGHYFESNTTDPWSAVGYTFTTRRGRALFKFAVNTAARDVAEKPFIIHDNAGARVACGMLTPVASGRLPKHAAQILNMKQLPSVEDVEADEEAHCPDGTLVRRSDAGEHKSICREWDIDGEAEEKKEHERNDKVGKQRGRKDNSKHGKENMAGMSNVHFAKLMPLSSHGPQGWVAVAVTPTGLVGAGLAKGLEAGLRASPVGTNCTATNGCGTHVHSGTACTNASTQGGHYFAANATDPWSSVGYTFTTRRGRALFKFAMETGAQDIAQKPFIIHNNAGGRVACGLLAPIVPGKLPKHLVDQLLDMKQLPTVEDVEEAEQFDEDELVDADADEEDDDDDEDDEDDDDDDDDHEDEREHNGRHLAATPILI